MQNLKIRTRLIIILLISVVATLTTAVIGIININNLSTQSKTVNETIVTGLNDLVAMQNSFDVVRIRIRDSALTSDSAATKQFLADADNAYDSLLKSANDYLGALEKHHITSGDEYNNLTTFINGLPQMKSIADKIKPYAEANDLETCVQIINDEFAPINKTLNVSINNLADINKNLSLDAAKTAQQTEWIVIITMASVVVVVVLILVIFILMVTRSIVAPINRMVEASNDLANGNLNMNLSFNTKDEIGELASGLGVAVDTINRLISDLSNMGIMHNEKGEIDIFVDEKKYKGAYGEVVKNVNDMVIGHIEVKKKAMACIGAMGKGNFDAPIEKLPGKKIFVNEAIEEMRKNLKDVGIEINTMVSEALKGNLSVQAKADHYEGGWAEIMIGLNEVLGSITAPVMESSKVLQEMAKGNLNVKVSGNFKGDLALLSNSLNTTIEAVSSYVKEISYVLGEIANANLNVTVDRVYIGDFSSIKEAMVTIINRLNEIISNINSATEQVSAGARNISESSITLATGATEQASSVEELSATIDIINEQTRKNAQNAMSANTLSEGSKTDAMAGNKEMQKMLSSMDGIKESSNNISKVIKTIEDIAFQTNLLALNAAVEAARAGEHGKGFAVVAEEVRNLAERSQSAAKETAAMIEESIVRVNEGSRIASSTAVSLETIVNNVNEVSGIISDITTSSAEQANAISQVTVGLTQISSVVQSNSATSEESAAAAEELSSQSETLSAMVSIFTLKK